MQVNLQDATPQAADRFRDAAGPAGALGMGLGQDALVPVGAEGLLLRSGKRLGGLDVAVEELTG